jgi:hypothetical protein
LLCGGRMRPSFLSLVALLSLATLVSGCETGERCSGNSVERWKGDEFGPGGSWVSQQTCAPGDACVELDVPSGFNDSDRAFCALSDAQACAAALGPGGTGRTCTGSGSLMTCVQGFHVRPGNGLIYGEACPDERPFCVEPEAGLAFCVADPAPSPRCEGHEPRPMEFCAVSSTACFQASFAQFCVDDRTSVTCLGGVEIGGSTCDAGGLSGRCIETDWLDVSPCRFD